MTGKRREDVAEDKKRRIKKIFLQYFLIAALVFVDRIIKMIVENRLRPIEQITILDGVLGLRYKQNTGAAFSLFAEHTNLLSIFTGVVIIAGLVYLILEKNSPLIMKITIPCILAGGTGNLIDRIIQGYVTDYIEFLFIDFAVFNFADMLVTCGCFVLLLFLIYSLIKEKKDGNS